MFKSEAIDELMKALVAAQKEMPPAPKNGTNPFYNNRKYTTIDKLIETSTPVLAKHGLAVLQLFEPVETGVLNIVTMLGHTSGQYIGGVMALPVEKATPQGMGSSATYGRRYGWAAIIGMASDEDDDGNSSEPKPSQPPKADQPNGNASDFGDLI